MYTTKHWCSCVLWYMFVYLMLENGSDCLRERETDRETGVTTRITIHVFI